MICERIIVSNIRLHLLTQLIYGSVSCACKLSRNDVYLIRHSADIKHLKQVDIDALKSKPIVTFINKKVSKNARC